MSRRASVAVVAGYSATIVALAALAYWGLPRWDAYHRLPGDAEKGEPVRLRIVEAREDGSHYATRVDRPTQSGRLRVTQPRGTRLPRPSALREGAVFVGRAIATGEDQSAAAITLVRDRPLVVLTAILLLLVGLAGGVQGVRVAGAILLAMVLIVFGLLPLSLRGWNPLVLVVPLAFFLLVVTLPLISGWSEKTRVAIVSSIAGVFVCAVLAFWCCHWLKFVGLDVEFGPTFHLDTQYWYTKSLRWVRFDYLLVAGMILSSLGAVMDISMDVCSSVTELKGRAGELGGRALAGAGLRVGHDVMCMMALMLAFVSIGTELDHYVALTQRGDWHAWVNALNFENMSAEVTRLTVCGIGMLVAMAVAALLGGFHLAKSKTKDVKPAAQVSLGQPYRPASARLPQIVNLACAAGLIGVAGFWVSNAACRGGPHRSLARVVTVEPAVEDPQLQVIDEVGSDRRRKEGLMKTRVVGVEIITGPQAGQRLALTLLVHPNPAARIPLAEGDVARAELVLMDGKVNDVIITKPLLRSRKVPMLAAAFLIVLLIVGGVRGLRTVLAIAFVGVATFALYLPMVAKGSPAVWVTVGFSAAVFLATFAISGKLGRKSMAALAGVVLPLALVGLLALVSVDALGLTGKQTTSAVVMSERAGQVVDFRDLLSASMIVVVLGMAVDIAVGLASAVALLYEARPNLRPWAAFSSGMAVSRDVTGTMLTTMFFAYLGARLPVLLFPSVAGISVAETVNSEPGSIEIVRLLIGGIGLVLTGPMTVAASVAVHSCLPRRETTSPPVRSGQALLWAMAGVQLVALVALTTAYAGWRREAEEPLRAGRAAQKLDQRIATTADVDELVQLAYDWSVEGEHEAATFAAWRARELAPHSAAPHIATGYVYAHRRWLPNALPAFERATHCDPKNVTALYYAGHVHVNLRQYKEAVMLLTKAATINPESVDVLYELATALTHLREWHAAEQYALKAYFLAPEEERILELIDCIGVDEKLLERVKNDVEARKRKGEKQ